MSSVLFHEPPTAIDVINVAKVISGVMILFAGGKYGWTPRSTIYASLHMSYLAWFMLEQYFLPSFWNRFSTEAKGQDWMFLTLFIGVFYTLPAYNVFCRKDRVTQISPLMTVVCVMMFTIGSLINTSSDVFMHAMKEATAPKKVLITTGLHRLCQNPNWFGDYLRYSSFCLSSGKASSFLVLAFVMFMNYSTTTDADLKGGMRERYGPAYDEWVENVPNVIVPSFGNNHMMEVICGVIAVWCTSYGLGTLVSSKSKVKTA